MPKEICFFLYTQLLPIIAQASPQVPGTGLGKRSLGCARQILTPCLQQHRGKSENWTMCLDTRHQNCGGFHWREVDIGMTGTRVEEGLDKNLAKHYSMEAHSLTREGSQDKGRALGSLEGRGPEVSWGPPAGHPHEREAQGRRDWVQEWTNCKISGQVCLWWW